MDNNDYNFSIDQPTDSTPQNQEATPLEVAYQVSDQRKEQGEAHKENINHLIEKVNEIPNGNYIEKFKSFFTSLSDKHYDDRITSSNSTIDQNLDTAEKINSKKFFKTLGITSGAGLATFGINLIAVGGIGGPFSLPWALGIGGAAIGAAAISSAIENRKQKAAEYTMKREERNVQKFETGKEEQKQQILERLNNFTNTEADKLSNNIGSVTENLKNKHLELTRKIAEVINTPKRDPMGRVMNETSIEKILRSLETITNDNTNPELANYLTALKDRNIFSTLKDSQDNSVNSDAMMGYFARKLGINRNRRSELKTILLLLQTQPIPVKLGQEENSPVETLSFRQILATKTSETLGDYFDSFKDIINRIPFQSLLTMFTGSDFRNVVMQLPTEESPRSVSRYNPAARTAKNDINLYQRFRELTGDTSPVE